MVWNKILGLFQRSRTPKVVISGLKKDAKFFQESIQEEASDFVDKASKVINEIDGITIHVKSSGIGKTEKFELHGLLSARNIDFHAKSSGRKLNLVLKDLFDELMAEVRKRKSKLIKGKKGRESTVEVEGR